MRHLAILWLAVLPALAFADPAAKLAPPAKSEARCPLPAAKAHPSDPHVTPQRCVKTMYSYAGCTEDYPREARACLHDTCHAGDTFDASIRNTLCTHEADLMLDGIGGPRLEKDGLAQLDKNCTSELVIACAHLGLRLASPDPKRATIYYHRACDDTAKAPGGNCHELRVKLKLAEPAPKK
jgi:hypothetical protein